MLKFDKEEDNVEDDFEALSQQVRPIMSISILIELQIHVVEVVIV